MVAGTAGAGLQATVDRTALPKSEPTRESGLRQSDRNRLMRTRMSGGVGAEGSIPSATRFASLLLLDVVVRLLGRRKLLNLRLPPLAFVHHALKSGIVECKYVVLLVFEKSPTVMAGMHGIPTLQKG